MRKKIEFLDRMFKVLHCRNDILEHLKLQKLITDDVMQGILHDAHQTHSTRIAGLLDELASTDKVQLVSYEWTILPKELMKLTIVTDSDKKEFVYSV
jgi:sulfur carrier protein ThiS